jgi:hypothetical protein
MSMETIYIGRCPTGWAIYRRGELLAKSFENSWQAEEWAQDYCDRNGICAYIRQVC